MKFLSWVFMGFAVFALIIDFSNVGVWSEEVIHYYRVLDMILAVMSLAAILVLWGFKLRSDFARDMVVKSITVFVLVWSGIVTGLDMTSLGFSTYILVLVASAFFLYLPTATAILFYSVSALSLFLTVLLRGEMEHQRLGAFVATLLPILIITILLSRRTFVNRFHSIEQNNELLRLNDELSVAKEELEEKVMARTQELLGVNAQLVQTNEALTLAKKKAEESDQLKTVFLNNMSHEIRTPMNGIMGFAELLGMPDLSEDKRNSYLNIVINSSQQLLKIIDDILEISSLQAMPDTVKNDTFCINELLADLYAIFSLKHQNAPIQFFMGKKLPEGAECQVVSDQMKLHKIISNLLENAFKFTLKGEIELGCYKKKDRLAIYVKDSGVGITVENQTVVFQRFFQEEKELSRNSGGLGIGLSIVKENTRLLGGDILLESEKGKGSTFTLMIPFLPN